MIGDEKAWSFARRQSTEPFYPVFGGDCLLLPSPCFRDDLVCGFVPSNDCRK